MNSNAINITDWCTRLQNVLPCFVHIEWRTESGEDYCEVQRPSKSKREDFKLGVELGIFCARDQDPPFKEADATTVATATAGRVVTRHLTTPPNRVSIKFTNYIKCKDDRTIQMSPKLHTIKDMRHKISEEYGYEVI